MEKHEQKFHTGQIVRLTPEFEKITGVTGKFNVDGKSHQSDGDGPRLGRCSDLPSGAELRHVGTWAGRDTARGLRRRWRALYMDSRFGSAPAGDLAQKRP